MKKEIKLLSTDRVIHLIRDNHPALGKLIGTKYYPSAVSKPLRNRVSHRTVIEFENGTIELPSNTIENSVVLLTINEK